MPSLPLSATPESLMAIDTAMRDEDDSSRDRVRLRSPPPRPRSYHQLLEDFQDHDHSRFELTSPVEEEGTTEDESTLDAASLASSKRHTVNLTEDAPARREDTARRNKRFSLPAVALQTTSVTTRSGGSPKEGSRFAGGVGYTRSKRFSLVLGHKGSHMLGHGSTKKGISIADGNVNELGQGAAAGKLSELLGKKVSVVD